VDAKVSFVNTDKHILSATTITEAEAHGLVAMAEAVAGGAERLREKPVHSSVETSIAPLQHEAGNIDAALIFGNAGIPVAIFTMPGPGATGPVTLAGSIAVAAMEFLSGLVMCRLNDPKAPVIWGCGVAPLDMKATTRAGGSPEHGMTGAAITQIAHMYGIPSLCGGFDSTASAPGTQAALEHIVSGFSLVLGGADLIVGIGQLEDARTLWLEELLIDDETINMIRRIADGIVVDDDHIALDVIKKVGIGGMFLGQRHTMEHLRHEHFIPKIVDRRSFDQWEADGRKTMEDRARARIPEILAAPVPHPLSSEVVGELDRIIERASVAVARA
jgi:trimethylamine--corrinoid protein Co-methyltransferase